MGRPMRVIATILIASALTACASGGSSETIANCNPEPSFPAAVNSNLASQFDTMARERTCFLKKHATSKRGRRTTNALTVLGAIGSTAVTAFDGGATAIAATTLTTGSIAQIRDTFTPSDRPKFYVSAADSMRCMARRANELNPQGPPLYGDLTAYTPNDFAQAFDTLEADVTGGATLSSQGFSSTNYQDIDFVLQLLITLGHQVEPKPPALVTALTSAQAARGHLATGIAAQREAESTLNDGILAVRRAVNNLSPPDIEQLVMNIAKLPQQAQPTTNNMPAAMAADRMDALEAAEALPGANINNIIILLNLVIARVDALRPQADAEAIGRITACVAAFSAQDAS